VLYIVCNIFPHTYCTHTFTPDLHLSPLYYPSVPFPLRPAFTPSLHCTALHFTTLLDDFHFTSLTSRRPENVAQLRAHIVKLCRALSEDLCRKVVTNARVRLQEVVRQNGGHIDHVLH